MSITNPIILAIIAGALSYVLMLYFCKEDNNKKKGKKGKSKSKKKGSNEMVIIVPVIIALGTWFFSSYYLTDDNSSNTAAPVRSDSDSLLDLNNVPATGKGFSIGSLQQNNNPAMATVQRGGNIPHISSDDPTRSYNLIGSGLNIPRSELKIPSVLIDYQ